MRTPKFEFLLNKNEIGVDISLDDEEFELNLLKEVIIVNNIITLVSTHVDYEVDLKRVDQSKQKEMIKFLNKLNFDKTFTIRTA